MSVETIKKPAMTDGSRAGAGANQALYDNQSIADSRLIVNAKDHLEFLHGDSHPSAYAHIWLKYADSNQKRFSHRKVGALDNWADLDDLRGKPDVYVGINPLYRPYRKNSNVSDINWIWVDLDKPEHAPYDWAYKTTLKVEADVFEKELLPLPKDRKSTRLNSSHR